MNTRQILKNALKECDREEVASFLKMSVGTLNNQVAGELPYQPKGQTPNMLDRIYDLIDVTYTTTGNMIILEKLAEEFGFMVIPNPVVKNTNSPAIAQIATILREFSNVVDEIGVAHADGIITVIEAEHIRAKWEIMKRSCEEFVLACEVGKYNATQKTNQE